MPLGQLSDEVLIARTAGGDASALEALYDRYAPLVLGVALKITGDRSLAESVLQETFWHAWKHAGARQPQRESFSSWLIRIARGLALDVDHQRIVNDK